MTAIFLTALYLVCAFLIASMTVRFAPRSQAARRFRRHIAWCVLLPVLSLMSLMQSLSALAGHGGITLRRLFEWLSGRKQHRRYTYYGASRRG